jgi:Spy/CpxP family protein refolding chaperone
MSHKWLNTLVVAFALGAVGSVSAQPPRNPPPGRPAAPTASTGKFLMIPGMAPLSMEAVQRDIGLTPEQRQRLKAISDGFSASINQLSKSMEGVPPEEQERRGKEANDRAAQLARNAQHQAETILSPQQLKVVQKIAFELSAAGALSDPSLQDKLGLSPEQRRRLNAVYEKAGEKMQQLQRDTASQVMELLDDDQAAALKRQIEPQQKSR